MHSARAFIFLSAAVIGLGVAMTIAGCAQRSDTNSGGGSSASAVKYTCSMHPDVVSDKPGKCSKCGMDLVVKK